MNEYSAEPGTPQTYTKAIMGAVVSFLALAGPVLWFALDAQSAGGEKVTSQEAVAIVLAGIGVPAVTGVAVAKARNRPKLR